MTTLGKKFSEESRRRMSIAQKRIGNKPKSWIGRKHSEESKKKMSISASLRKRSQLSEETKRKISGSNKGKKRSPETCKKLSIAGSVPKPWMIGNDFQKGSRNVHFGKFGKDHPCWKDEKKHSFHKQIREIFKYRQWRSDVFTRDNFTCVLCKVRGGYLEADHIKMFALIVKENNIRTLEEAIHCEELWNINNGRTLCKKCHTLTDTYKKHITT